MADTLNPKGSLSFTAIDRSHMESNLAELERQLQRRARTLGDRGILITRSSPTHFTLELNTAVPYGMTYTKQEW